MSKMTKIHIVMPREYALTLRQVLDYVHDEIAISPAKEKIYVLRNDLRGCLGGYPYTSRGTVKVYEEENDENTDNDE